MNASWAPHLDCPHSSATRMRRRYLPLLAVSAVAAAAAVLLPTHMLVAPVLVSAGVWKLVHHLKDAKRCDERDCCCGECLRHVGRFQRGAVAEKVAERAQRGGSVELVGIVLPAPVEWPGREAAPEVWAAFVCADESSGGAVLELPAGASDELARAWPQARLEVVADPQASTVELARRLTENLDAADAVRTARAGTR